MELAGPWRGSGGIAAPVLGACVSTPSGVDRAGGSRTRAVAAPAIRFGTGALLSALAAVCAMLALHGPIGLERLVGVRTARPAAEILPATSSTAASAQPLPTLRVVSQDAAGS